ncbi:MAG: hypothetical protein AAB225_05175, partial [Acidobacteriota bacterium]
MRFTACLTLTLACAGAQGPPPVVFEERPGVLLANDKVELTILTQGGSLASLVLREDAGKLNPMWNPARMAREAGQKPGGGGALGHFVCVDGFGPVSPEEQAAGMPGHGEAHRQPWEIRQFAREGRVQTLTFSARLPLVQETFTRTLRLVDGEQVIYVESTLENLLGFDRPVCWAEHATIGSPFLEPGKTVVDMPAARAKTRAHPARPGKLARRLASFQDFTWPMAPGVDGRLIDLRAAPENPSSIDHTTCLMDPARELAFVTALHLDKRLLLGYVFRREEYPWLQSWENYPPNLRMARGLEFSSQPFDVPRREAIQLNSLFGAPVYRWLAAKSKIGSRFLLFYARVPEGVRKIDDVRIEGGQLIIEDRAAG